mmetsp:Transcript_25139/g.46929  ORF Transcript_25139/g.46929 Transcript_25139/m.46929 type:complete len:94 (-) Transcript_25139:160-441(-)
MQCSLKMSTMVLLGGEEGAAISKKDFHKSIVNGVKTFSSLKIHFSNLDQKSQYFADTLLHLIGMLYNMLRLITRHLGAVLLGLLPIFGHHQLN